MIFKQSVTDSEFGIWNSEFKNSEFRIQITKFGIVKWYKNETWAIWSHSSAPYCYIQDNVTYVYYRTKHPSFPPKLRNQRNTRFIYLDPPGAKCISRTRFWIWYLLGRFFSCSETCSFLFQRWSLSHVVGTCSVLPSPLPCLECFVNNGCTYGNVVSFLSFGL